MRELFLSVGITLLTSTLLFVYFRNKHNNLDEKVNLVFTTIQEHNEKMQLAADEEMQRMAQFQRHQQMQMQMMHSDEHTEQLSENEKEENVQGESEQNNLIDVSDGENDNENFDSDDSDSDSDDSDDETENKDDNLEELESLNLEKEKDNEISLISETDYTKLTKNKLKDLCEQRDISGYKSCNKGKLIQLLVENDNDNKLGLE